MGGRWYNSVQIARPCLPSLHSAGMVDCMGVTSLAQNFSIGYKSALLLLGPQGVVVEVSIDAYQRLAVLLAIFRSMKPYSSQVLAGNACIKVNICDGHGISS